MSATGTAARQGQRPTVPGAPPFPQVNLLPPEIRASRSLSAIKRVLALALVGVLVLLGATYAVIALQLAAAEDELADAQAETARLLAAQQEYAEVPQVLGQLDDATTARRLGMSTEILWREPLDKLVGTLPPGVFLTSVRVTGQTPVQAAPFSTNPLLGQSVATIEFTGRSLTLPDTSAWIEALETIPSWQDAFVTSVAVTEGTTGSMSGVTYYENTGTVQVTADAWALRFEQTEEED